MKVDSKWKGHSYRKGGKSIQELREKALKASLKAE